MRKIPSRSANFTKIVFFSAAALRISLQKWKHPPLVKGYSCKTNLFLKKKKIVTLWFWRGFFFFFFFFFFLSVTPLSMNMSFIYPSREAHKAAKFPLFTRALFYIKTNRRNICYIDWTVSQQTALFRKYQTEVQSSILAVCYCLSALKLTLNSS